VAIALLAACAPSRQAELRDAEVTPETALTWMEEAHEAMAEGHFARAEELLRDVMMAGIPANAEALEAAYWRALLRLDPANEFRSAREAVRLLELYLSSNESVQHRFQAESLRRTALAMDSLERDRGPLMELQRVRDSLTQALAREVELQRELTRSREALERSNAELERIRRRLGAPPAPR
jgi:hypothetical protein